MRIGGKKVLISLHRMLAECYIPNPNNHRLVRHLNDVSDDNRLSNLAWGEDIDNVRDAFKNGLMQHNNHLRGSKSHKAKLKEPDVEKIRTLHEGGEKIKVLAQKYKVSNSTIERIVNKTKWAHV
jgi:helix-turn-helix resolvase-like protein